MVLYPFEGREGEPSPRTHKWKVEARSSYPGRLTLSALVFLPPETFHPTLTVVGFLSDKVDNLY